MKILLLTAVLLVSTYSAKAQKEYRQVTHRSNKAVVSGDTLTVYKKDEATTYLRFEEKKRISKYINEEGHKIETFKPLLRGYLLFVDGNKYAVRHEQTPSYIAY